MSGRRNGTNKAAARLGPNPYGWGNGGKRKRPEGSGRSHKGLAKQLMVKIVADNGGKVNGRSVVFG